MRCISILPIPFAALASSIRSIVSSAVTGVTSVATIASPYASAASPVLPSRSAAHLARAEQGYDIDQIANDIGMSTHNVNHYMRFRDQMKVGADGQKLLRLVGKED
jgi:hypothetical protein